MDYKVGSQYPLKTLADVAINLKPGNRFLFANETFAMPKAMKIAISGVSFDAIDPNNRPTFVFNGGEFSHAFELANGTGGITLRNLKVSLPPKSWAIRPCGQQHVFERIKVTQGGMMQSQAGDILRNITFNQCKAVGDHITKYFAYVAGDVDGLMLHDCECVPNPYSALVRVMTGKNVTVKGGRYVQDYPTGMKAQAFQLRGHANLTLDGAEITGLTTGALEVGALPWDAGSQYTASGVMVKNSTLKGYINCQPGTIDAHFENNHIDGGPGAGGYVFSLKGDQKMYNPMTKVNELQVTGRPHATATITNNIITGGHLISGKGLTDGGGNLFNGTLTKPATSILP